MSEKPKDEFAELANKAGFAKKCEHCGSPDVGFKWNVFAYMEHEGRTANPALIFTGLGSGSNLFSMPMVIFLCHQCGFTRQFQREPLRAYLEKVIAAKEAKNDD